jgi:hypothetical protein
MSGRQKGRSVDDGRRHGGASDAVQESWREIGRRAEATAQKLENERSTAATAEAIEVLREVAHAIAEATQEGLASSEAPHGEASPNAEA